MRRKLGLFAYTEERNCPVCGSEHVHRTKRGRLVEFWVLLFLPYRPYRCGKCRQRFYGPKHMPQREELEGTDPIVKNSSISPGISEDSEPHEPHRGNDD